MQPLAPSTLYVFFIALAASAFFSASEAAFFSLGRIGESRLTRKKNLLAKAALYLLQHFHRLVFVVLGYNLLANITAASLAATIFESALPRAQQVFPFFTSPISDAAFVVSYTLFFLLIAEFFPKQFAVRFSFFYALFSSVPLITFYFLISPFIHLVEAVGRFAKKTALAVENASYTGVKNSDDGGEVYSSLAFSHKEMLGFIRESQQKGVLQLTESRLLESLVACFNVPVKTVLIPREKMRGIEYSELKNKNILARVKAFPYVNIPIYRKQKDDVVGVLSKRYFLRHYYNENDRKNKQKKVAAFIQTPLILPENKNILDVLIDISSSSCRVALLSDEFGGIEGMVVYEDIVAKIFGKRLEEEGAFPQIEQLKKNLFLFLGDISLDDFNRYFSVEISCEQAETLSGYLLENFKHFPVAGDRYTDKWFRYEIEKASAKRIHRVMVKKLKGRRR